MHAASWIERVAANYSNQEVGKKEMGLKHITWKDFFFRTLRNCQRAHNYAKSFQRMQLARPQLYARPQYVYPAVQNANSGHITLMTKAVEVVDSLYWQRIVWDSVSQRHFYAIQHK